MPNKQEFRFPLLNGNQTHRLLKGVPSLPLPVGAEHRIRARVLQQAAPKSLARNRIRRTLVPIAACLLVVVFFFVAFPKAALAVSEFLGRVFTPSRYMNEDPAQRTAVPSIDEAIAASVPKDGDYTITLMPDLPNAQEFIDYRAKNGYEPFSEENWGWLRDIRPEIAEVLYDGNQLIWNTNLYTANEHVREFMEGFGIQSGSKLRVDALTDDASYTVAGDPTEYPLSVSGDGITPINEEAALSSADHVVLYSDFMIDAASPLPDGVLSITQNIRVCENDAMDYGATLALIQHTFTFDTTKGNTPAAALQEGDIPLSGEIYLSMEHMAFAEDGSVESWTVDTKQVSLDGVVLHANYEYLPTGISVTLSLASAPESWSEDMVNALLYTSGRDIDQNYHRPGNVTDLYVNGAFVSEAPTADSWGFGEQKYILPIYPDQYANTQSVVLKLTHVYFETRNGTNQLAGEVFTIPEGVTETVATYKWEPLVEIPIPLPD